MREIKFRVWDIEKKQMLHIHTLFLKNKDEICPPGILMQYTGLKDKNGKEIYEGDIVHFQSQFSHESFTEVVGWEIENGDEMGTYTGFGLFYKAKEYEVIGNIYENPELLETK